MDSVSSLKFDFKLIRTPRKKSSNIFAYAASLTIMSNNNVFLYVEDICIIDFIYKLSSYNGTASFLVVRRIKDDIVELSSEWTKQIVKVDFQQFVESIKNLKICFEKKAKICINEFFDTK